MGNHRVFQSIKKDLLQDLCPKSLQSCLTVTLWTATLQVPLSMGFSRQDYWSGLPCSSPGNLPDPGIEPTSLMSSALTGGFFTSRTTWEAKIGFNEVKSLSHVQLFAIPWTVAYHTPPSMESSRQEYWSGLPFPSPKLGLINNNKQYIIL